MKLLATFSFIFWSLGSLAEPPIHNITLDRAIEIAVEQSTSVLQGKSELDLSATPVLQAYGQFLPDLNVGASFGYDRGRTVALIQGRSVEDTAGRDASFSVTSDLNIFNGLADFDGLNSSMARQDAARRSLDWAKIQVALDVTQTYMQLVLDRLLYDISLKNLEASKARYQLIRGQARVGSASKADLFRQEAETSNDEFSKLSYETKIQNDQVALIRKLRLKPNEKYIFAQPLLEPQEFKLARMSTDDLIEQALRDRPDYRASKLILESSNWDVRRAEGSYLPKLDLMLARNATGRYLTSYTVNGVDATGFSQPPLFDQLGDQVEYTAMLTLTWNLFDHFNTTEQVQKQVNIRTFAELAKEDNEFQIYNDVKVAYADYQIALKQLETARTGLQSSQKSYDVVEGLYEVGTDSIVDILTAQAALSQARSNEAKALANLKLQEKVLQYSIGKLAL